jgi:hypothetical protein
MGERQSLVVVNDASMAWSWRNAHVVRTMLDMIAWLERAGEMLVTVVLGGTFARDTELASFLRETYPSVDVVASTA